MVLRLLLLENIAITKEYESLIWFEVDPPGCCLLRINEIGGLYGVMCEGDRAVSGLAELSRVVILQLRRNASRRSSVHRALEVVCMFESHCVIGMLW